MLPRLSICIPTYNGLPHLEKLLNSLMKCTCQELEIVVTDDCSVDGTWEFLMGFKKQDRRVRIFRNDLNLGMDRNFARSVELAGGEFVWLCGQDDLIAPQGIEAVVDLIVGDKSLDFIHMPYVMQGDANAVEDWRGAPHSASPLRGIGLFDFMGSNYEKLPTFLPEFVIRRSLWQKVDVTRYFGTCYCQVGVFIEVSDKLHWCRLRECYVAGSLPQDGWQANPLSYARIIFGYFVMLDRSLKRESGLTVVLARQQYSLHLKQLIYALLLVRALDLEDRVILLEELQKALRRSLRCYLLFATLMYFPRFLCRFTLRAIILKREVRRKLSE